MKARVLLVSRLALLGVFIGSMPVAAQTAARSDSVTRLVSSLASLPDRDAQHRLLDENTELLGPDLGTALIDRGRQARNAGDRPLAMRFYELAREVGERSALPAIRAQALDSIGLVHYDTGNYSEALDSYKRSVAISEAIDDQRGIARTFNNLGVLYSDIGELTVAEGYFARCMAIGERLKDSGVGANALGNLAIIAGRRGDYATAVASLQRRYGVDEATGNKRALAADLLNLGNVYFWQGDYRLAEDHFRRATTVSAEANLRVLTAIGYLGLGQVAEFKGDLAAALRQYSNSLRLFEEIDDKPYAASALSFIGSAHLKAGDAANAVAYFRRSVDLHRAIGAGAELPLALTGLAAAYNRANRPDEALASAREAGDLARGLNAREAAWRARLEAGKARLASGDVSQGEAELAEAISTVESLRLDVAGGEFERQGYFADKLEPYHRLVSLLVDSGRTSDALAYAERAKARVIVDVFSAGRARVESVMSDAERAQDQGFRIKLASLNARLAKERQRPPLTTGLTAEIDRARLDYAAFQAGLFARHPQLKAQRGAIDAVSIGDLGRLLPRDGAMLEFVVTEDALYAFVVTRDANGSSTPAVQVTRTPVSRSDLRGRVEDFQQRIANRDLAFRRSASDLYGLLIAPVRGLLGRARSLIIVPDATLWELPFQALLSPSGRYLLDDVAVSYAPSLTALMLMQRQKQRLDADHQAPGLLAMGNPAWDPRARNRPAATSRDAELGSLELTEVEVSRLAGIYGRARSRVYVRDQATERRFKEEAGDQQILHIATHGILNDASPLYSHVLLAPSSAPGLEDGLLEAWELLQMALHARLVVLSACETARGRVTAGEGTIGLSWALFVAGVPTTVLSQWKADSASTTELMVAFHENVKRGMNEAAALRAASLNLRKNPAYAHPVYWAPFIVIGAGQAAPADSRR